VTAFAGASIRAAFLLTFALLVAACEPSAEAEPANGQGFDFYVLSLSWSPSYCEAEGAGANRQQCGGGRDHGFVVHGLWPQFERSYPEYCRSREPDRVPDDIVRRNLDLMPSAGLIGQQWRKHGSCTGLTQSRYFDVVRAAVKRVVIPPAYRDIASDRQVDPDRVEMDFVSANAGLGRAGVAVTCDRRYLREVRICLTKELGFRDCPEIQRNECRADRTELPAP
jgi:ribonuclease T2